MEMWIPILISVLGIAVTGAIIVMLPQVTRRGLLFGVYVGDEPARSERAGEITRSWYRGMILTVCACVGAGALMILRRRPVLALVLPDALLLLGLGLCYYRAHVAAREIVAARGPVAPAPPPAVASLSPSKPGLGLPVLVMLIGAAVGLSAIWYAWSNYGELPDRVPTHFGASGRPDAWSAKSFSSVMVLPLGTLFTGVGMGALGCFLARSKRALRLKDGGVSLAAQQRFRTAMVVFISGVALIVTAMLGVMSFESIRVGLGLAARMSNLVMYLGIGLALFTVGGIIYIAVRLGQGGSKLEGAAAGAPLTDGLADNAKWKWGTFYVNRDDPSMFVEHRFGIGYTINFANPKAIAFLVAFMVLVVVLPLVLAVTQ